MGVVAGAKFLQNLLEPGTFSCLRFATLESAQRQVKLASPEVVQQVVSRKLDILVPHCCFSPYHLVARPKKCQFMQILLGISCCDCPQSLVT